MPFRMDKERQGKVDPVFVRRPAEDMAGDLPSGPGVHGFSGQPTAGFGGEPSSNGNRPTFMVIRWGQEGVREIKRFYNELLAQLFLVELMSGGEKRDAVEVYQVSSLQVDVSYRPSVRFGGS